MVVYKFFYDINIRNDGVSTNLEKGFSREIEVSSDEEAVEKAKDLIKTFNENPPSGANKHWSYEYILKRVVKELWRGSLI